MQKKNNKFIVKDNITCLQVDTVECLNNTYGVHLMFKLTKKY